MFLSKEVVPFVDQWEKEGLVPRETWKKTGEQGFLCTSVPEKYGGQGMDYVSYIIATEEIARIDGSHAASPCATVATLL